MYLMSACRIYASNDSLVKLRSLYFIYYLFKIDISVMDWKLSSCHHVTITQCAWFSFVGSRTIGVITKVSWLFYFLLSLLWHWCFLPTLRRVEISFAFDFWLLIFSIFLSFSKCLDLELFDWLTWMCSWILWIEEQMRGIFF